MVKAVLERGMAVELTEHLGHEKGHRAGRGSPNSRNGTTPKTLATEIGPARLDVPRDRAGSFEPRLVPKGSRRAGGLGEMISRIPEFIKASQTIRKHRDGITAAIDRGLSNGRHEGLNNKIRLIIRRAYGFHSAEAALATIMLACGPVNLKLPYHTPTTHAGQWQ